jgi:uncharacterized protein YifE (UPF0438 family)
MDNREQLLSIPYYDFDKFPYGFSRSGDFSIAESIALEKMGTYYKALLEIKLDDCDKDEIRLKKVFQGKLEPQSFEEETWLKYLGKNKRCQIGLVAREKKQYVEEEYEDREFDIDLNDDF